MVLNVGSAPRRLAFTKPTLQKKGDGLCEKIRTQDWFDSDKLVTVEI